MDQGSAVEIIYSDLYKGLNLKDEDLMPYNSPLVSFEGKIVIPKVRSDYLCRLVRRWWR